MSEAGSILTALLAALSATAPTCVCTRDFEPFENRKKTDLAAGVFTLIEKGGSEDDAATIDLLLIGQIKLAENATGSQVDEAEDLMMDTVRTWINNNTGVTVRIRGWRKSMQLDRPLGWIAVDLVTAKLIMTPNVNTAGLSDFLLFHAEHSQAPGTDEPSAIDEVHLNQ